MVAVPPAVQSGVLCKCVDDLQVETHEHLFVPKNVTMKRHFMRQWAAHSSTATPLVKAFRVLTSLRTSAGGQCRTNLHVLAAYGSGSGEG